MRIRILDRILVAVAGLILVAACAGLVSQVFFGIDVAGFITTQLSRDTTTARVMIGACAAILLLLGLYCILMLFRHRKRKDKFILQKMESGELAISLDTLETMVKKCLEQHPEIQAENICLENQRDGLLVRVSGTVAGGISIPLTVDTLQKQIKQYVTACSGVEVKGIRIQVEASGEDAKDAPFVIEGPTSILLPKGREAKDEPARGEESNISDADGKEEQKTGGNTDAPSEADHSDTSETSAAAAAMAAAENMMNEMDYEDDRPLHQRLFSMQEEPCIMPLPPENLVKETENRTGQDTDKETESSIMTEDGKDAETAPDGENRLPQETEAVEGSEKKTSAEIAEITIAAEAEKRESEA